MILNTIEIGLLSILIICFIIQLFFYLVVLAKPYYYMRNTRKEKLRPSALPPVSVIVCIKNTSEDLFRFLPNILEQEYPEFEVIIVTDGISDTDEEALTRLKNHYPNLYSTHVPEDTRNVSRKKLALTLGIKAAKYDNLLFTEPDSRIRTEKWISLMTCHFSEKKSIVLGFSTIEKARSFLQKYMAYDYFYSNLQIISFALLNRPYAGNRRNMAYKKKHFIEQKGFLKHQTLKQGEDDLFIGEIATGENTAVELSAHSVTFTKTNSFQDWKRQKIERMSIKRFYKNGPVYFWQMEAFLRILFFISVITLIMFRIPFQSPMDYLLPGIALFCFFVRLLTQYFVINKTAGRLQLRKFYLTVFWFDLFQPFINSYLFINLLLKVKENYIYRYEK